MTRLIFIHGAGSTELSWQFQSDYFSGAEMLTLPGHPKGKPCQSVEDYTDWIRDYINLGSPDELILAGHSMGGAIALEYAFKYGQCVKALILIGTGAKLRVHSDYLDFYRGEKINSDQWLQSWETAYAQVLPELRDKLLAAKKMVGPEVQFNDLLCCDKFDVMAEISRIHVPTLIICGSEDLMTPPKFAHHLASHIHGSKLVVIEGGTHMVPAEKPKEVNMAIKGFLLSLGVDQFCHSDR